MGKMACVTYLLLRKMGFITISIVLKANLCLLCTKSLEKTQLIVLPITFLQEQEGFFFSGDMNKNFRF